LRNDVDDYSNIVSKNKSEEVIKFKNKIITLCNSQPVKEG
jgi:hypothetical protein